MDKKLFSNFDDMTEKLINKINLNLLANKLVCCLACFNQQWLGDFLVKEKL